MENRKLLPVMDLIQNSFEIYKDRVWVLLGLMVITILSGVALLPGVIVLVVGGATGILSIMSGDPEAVINIGSFLATGGLVIVGLILILIGIIISIVIGIWCQLAAIYAIKERATKIGIKQSLSMGWPKLWSFLWVSILTGVVVFVGLCLFVVPGIIFIVWFYFAMYVLVIEGIKGTDSLKRSKQLVAGYWWPVAGRILVLCVVGMLLGWVPVLGTILTIVFLAPFGQIYNYLVYEDIKSVKS